MTLRPVRNSIRFVIRILSAALWLLAAVPLFNGVTDQAAAADPADGKRWTPAELADGIEAAIARVQSSELATRYFERRNTNAFGSGDPVFAGGSGKSLFRYDGQRWYCDDDGFTTRVKSPEAVSRRQVSGFDGVTHFDLDGDSLTYGEDSNSVSRFAPAQVFWGASRNADFLIGRLRADEARLTEDKVVDGLRQVSVQVEWAWGETAYDFHVTLLPERSFLPIEARTTVNGKPDGEWKAESLKQAEDVWYPSRVSFKRFLGENIERDVRTIVTSFRLRDDFAEADFQLASTINLDVFDHRTGTGYHNSPWWSDLAPFIRKQLNWPRPDTHAAMEYAQYGNAELIGKLAPELTVADWINGEPTTLTAPDRKLTAVIFFGGRAISPSPRSLSALRNLRALYHKNGFEVIGIASQSDTLDMTRRDVRSLRLEFPIAIDSPNDDPDGNHYGKTFDAFGLKAYYGFFLIDAEGVVREVSQEPKLLNGLLKPDDESRLGTLRANIVRYLHDAGEKDLDLGLNDLLQLDMKEIRQIEQEWKRLLAAAPRTAQLSGTITDSDGPIAGVTIEAVPSLRLLFTNFPGGYFLSKDCDQTLTMQTDAKGHFSANGLPKGVWELTISKPGHASIEREVTLESAESDATVDIENKQQDRIFGRVIDQNGDPIARASVKVDKRHTDPKRPEITTTAHLPRQPVQTDEEGRFEITRLYDGTYTLVVSAPNFESATEPHVSADGRELVIRLKALQESALLSPELQQQRLISGVVRSKPDAAMVSSGLAGFANVTDEPRKSASDSRDKKAVPVLTITGTVVDEGGMPIENASVLFSPPSTTVPSTFSALQLVPLNRSVRTNADSNGLFSVSLPDASAPRGKQITSMWRPVVCHCLIQAPGHASWEQDITLSPEWNWNLKLQPVTLGKPGDLKVYVTASTGNPLGHSSVEVTRYVMRGATQDSGKPLVGTTNQVGVAEFPGVLTGAEVLNLKVTSSNGKTVQTKRVQIRSADSENVTVTFDPTGSVAGQIYCSDPRQLAGLQLRVATTPRPINLGGRLVFVDWGRPRSSVIVRVDEKGRFQVDGLPVGNLMVQQVVDARRTWLLHQPPFEVPVEDGLVAKYKAELKPGIAVDGFVIDRQNSQPLGACQLALRPNAPGPRQIAGDDPESLPLTVEADGEFHPVLTPGTYHVTATNNIPGYSRVTVRQFEVKPDDERVEVKVLVARTLSMQAELVDEAGLPVANAWVAALSNGKLLTLKRASDIGIFEAWLADVKRADAWQVRIGNRRLPGTVLKEVPLKLQVGLKPQSDSATPERRPKPGDDQSNESELCLNQPKEFPRAFCGLAQIAEQARNSRSDLPAASRSAFTGFAQVAEQKPEEPKRSETPSFPTAGLITGNVVDEKGNPVAGALAVLETHASSKPDHASVEITAV